MGVCGISSEKFTKMVLCTVWFFIWHISLSRKHLVPFSSVGTETLLRLNPDSKNIHEYPAVVKIRASKMLQRRKKYLDSLILAMCTLWNIVKQYVKLRCVVQLLSFQNIFGSVNADCSGFFQYWKGLLCGYFKIKIAFTKVLFCVC